MKPVTVSQACGVNSTTVIVNQHATVQNFVSAVVIHIADANIVEPLSPPLFWQLFIAPSPSLDEFSVAIIPSLNFSQSVIAAKDYDAWMNAVKVSDCQQVSVYPVAVIIAPVGNATSLNPRGASQFFARHAVNDRQKLRTFKHRPSFVSVIRSSIAIRVADFSPVSEDRSLGGLTNDFGSAITVKVIDDKREVMNAKFNVPTQIHPPKESAIAKVGFNFESCRAGTNLRWVFATRRSDDDEIVFPIAVKVSDADSVDGKVFLRVGERFERDGNVLTNWRVCWQGERFARRSLPAINNRLHEIGNRLAQVNPFVHEICSSHNRLLVDPYGFARADLAIEVERYVVWIGCQHSPTDINSSLT